MDIFVSAWTTIQHVSKSCFLFEKKFKIIEPIMILYNMIQFSSVTQLCPTLCDPMDHSMPGLPVRYNSRSIPKLMSTELVVPSNNFMVCHPLLFPPSIFPSIGVFANESALCIRWPKYWSFSFIISPSMNIQD